MKKRGRKPKEKVEEERAPKKRGRKPKIKEYSVSHESVVFNIDNVSDNLFHLDKIVKDDFQINPPDNYEKVSFEPYNQNSPVFQTIENKNCDIIIPSVNHKFTKVGKHFEYLPSVFDNGRWPKTTDIHCWWCCHPFNTMPIPFPVKISKNYDTGEQMFYVKGCFCSFNCAKSWGCYTGDGRHFLLFSLFNKMNTSGGYHKIKRAPNRYLLDIFGGPLSIEEFRSNFDDSVKYELLPIPVISIKQSLEVDNHTPINSISQPSGLSIPKKEDFKVLEKNTLEHLMSMSIN